MIVIILAPYLIYVILDQDYARVKKVLLELTVIRVVMVFILFQVKDVLVSGRTYFF